MENNILEAHIQKHRALSSQKIKWKKKSLRVVISLVWSWFQMNQAVPCI